MNKLTVKQKQALTMLANGKNTAEVGRAIGVSESVASTTISIIYKKLGASNAAHAVAIGMSSGDISKASISTVSTKRSRAESVTLQLILEGMSNAEIAKIRGITVSTVKAQVSSLLQKYSVSSRSKLAAMAELEKIK